MVTLSSIQDPQLAPLISDAKVGVLPLAGCYRLVCLSLDIDADARLYGLKQRQSNPGIIFADEPSSLIAYGFDDVGLRAAMAYLPNQIAFVVGGPQEFGYIHQDVGTIPVCIPSNPQDHALLESTGPLLTSTAHPAGQPVATTLAQAQQYFGDSVDFYVDGGTLEPQTLTIARINGGVVEVLRQGTFAFDASGALIAAQPGAAPVQPAATTPPAPGQTITPNSGAGDMSGTSGNIPL